MTSLSVSDSMTSPAQPGKTGDLTVRVQDLSVTYRTTVDRLPTFKKALANFGKGQRRQQVREVHALRDVTFDVHEGTALGIIGANGAGKSTMMRAIAGILPPTTGRIEVNGRVSTLLSLGVGFNGSLTGRENILLGGLASGLSRREVAERTEGIIEFADLEEGKIDMPMRTYSSGMYSRLAFAVAVTMEPDILMIDEALSAGDAKFKTKAAAKMAELRAQARAMFLVSHSLMSIKDLCNDAIWMHQGRLMLRGEPEEVIAAYTDFVKVGRSAYIMEDL